MNRKVRGLKGQVFESNLEEFVNVTKSDEVTTLINRIRQTEDKDERRQLKGSLHIFLPSLLQVHSAHCLSPN